MHFINKKKKNIYKTKTSLIICAHFFLNFYCAFFTAHLALIFIKIQVYFLDLIENDRWLNKTCSEAVNWSLRLVPILLNCLDSFDTAWCIELMICGKLRLRSASLLMSIHFNGARTRLTWNWMFSGGHEHGLSKIGIIGMCNASAKFTSLTQMSEFKYFGDIQQIKTCAVF